jgi:hypothetical protein
MGNMTTTNGSAEKPARLGALKVRVVKPTVAKSARAASVRATKVRTKASVDFVKAVRGR